jgi:hypothetical protein
MCRKIYFLNLLFSVSCLLLSFHSQSQVQLPVKNIDAGNQIFLQIGFEPELVTTIGYSHQLSNTKSSIQSKFLYFSQL